MPDYKEYVHAVAMERSFSRAAEKLCVSQPWLSATVKRVEQELGCQLFDRSTNPISLTSEGHYYIDKIEQIMSIEREMDKYFAKLREGGAHLRIGSAMFFCTYVLPVLMVNFRAMYPQINVTLTEGSEEILSDSLLNGELDIVIGAESHNNARLENTTWASEELVLAVPSSFKINKQLEKFRYTFEEFINRPKGFRKPPVPLKEFANEPFLMLKEGNESYLRGNQMCKNEGFTPKVKLYLTQMMTAYYLVCEGQGISFLRSTIPEYVTPVKSVVFYQLRDPLAKHNIYLTWLKKGRTPELQRLIDFLREENRRKDKRTR